MVLDGEVKIENQLWWRQIKPNLYEKQWVVYANPPMGSVSQVVVSRNYKCTENGKLECTENGNNCAQLFCFQK
jgi:hypothetical protein